MRRKKRYIYKKKEKEKKVEVIYKKKYSRLTNEQNIHHREREERNKSHISKKKKHVLKNEKRKLREGGFDVEKGCSCCYKLSKTKKNFDEGRTRKSRRQSLRTGSWRERERERGVKR